MTLLAWPDYRLFEYERDLAEREVAALELGPAARTAEGLELAGDPGAPLPPRALERLTYVWRHGAGDAGEAGELTAQAVVELAHRAQRSRTAARQSTRFLVHGLHEYKGKFNPQLARALTNVVDPAAQRLFDPFCGSGTTLVEAQRLGLAAMGVDKSPLAAWISTVKTDVMAHPDPAALAAEVRDGVSRLTAVLEGAPAGVAQRSERRLGGLLPATATYLRTWFPDETLHPALAAVSVAEEVGGLAGDLLRLAVSNVARGISWQLPEDLRVRRRPADWIPPDPRPIILRELERTLAAVDEVAAGGFVARAAHVQHGDSADAAALAALPASDDRTVLVTSPPYATALPYIDTDRLAMVLAGLVEAPELRALEAGLTGAREWSRAVAGEWGRRRDSDADALPVSVTGLVARIDEANERIGVGFRRRDLPVLLYRYFAQMGDALQAWTAVLRPGERAVLVVGPNRTGKGADQIVIDTPELLADTAETRGYRHVETIALEAWPRFGLHAANAVTAERAIVLERV